MATKSSLQKYWRIWFPNQASKHCADAKDYLEMMCREMTEELVHFDLQKEKEMKQVLVLLEYTAAQLYRETQKVRIAPRSYVATVM